MAYERNTPPIKSRPRMSWLTRLIDGTRTRGRVTRADELPPHLREDIGLPRDTTYLNP